jgi:TPR repeat protein
MATILGAFLMLALTACDRTAQNAVTAYGKGDYKTAYVAYSKLAKEGDRDAQFTLGLMYFEGTGPDKDFAEAVRWYLRAANQGQVMAQNNLGAMYMDGKGVAQDFVESAFWLTLVANAGDPHAKQLRDAVAIRLSAVEQDTVRERVKNWKPKKE